MAAAIIASLKDDSTSMGKVYELGWPEGFTIRELAVASPRDLLLKKVPFPLPTPALTFSDLGIVPHKLKGYRTEYLISYRKGGPAFCSTVSERVTGSEF